MKRAAETGRKQISPPDPGGAAAAPGARLPGTAAFLWPALVAAEIGRLASTFARDIADLATPPVPAMPWSWTSDNEVVLALRTMELRGFTPGAPGVPTLICAPFSLHRAGMADLAPGHSLVATLRENGLRNLFVTDWRSATPDMRFLAIDDYLADLNVAIDDLGGRVNLVGICQGGWMGLMLAARFPAKVRRLVVAGAPVDIAAGGSAISAMAMAVPDAALADLVTLGDGRILGDRALEAWGARHPDAAIIAAALQSREDGSALERTASARFREWNALSYDLPGTYYCDVVERLFRQNLLAKGQFVALGRAVDLHAVEAPVFLLAAADDDIVAPAQVLGAGPLLSRGRVARAIVPGPHLSLFMGARTLAGTWPRIARWLRREPTSR